VNTPPYTPDHLKRQVWRVYVTPLIRGRTIRPITFPQATTLGSTHGSTSMMLSISLHMTGSLLAEVGCSVYGTSADSRAFRPTSSLLAAASYLERPSIKTAKSILALHWSVSLMPSIRWQTNMNLDFSVLLAPKSLRAWNSRSRISFKGGESKKPFAVLIEVVFRMQPPKGARRAKSKAVCGVI